MLHHFLNSGLWGDVRLNLIPELRSLLKSICHVNQLFFAEPLSEKTETESANSSVSLCDKVSRVRTGYSELPQPSPMDLSRWACQQDKLPLAL